MNAYVLDAIRSPMGRALKGSLAGIRADDLAGQIVAALLSRNDWLDPARVDDVIGATAMPEAEQGMNLGRIVAQRAGMPDSVPGMTLNRFCASGLEAVALAAAKVDTGMADVVVAFGVESMSRIPMGGNDFSPNPWLAAERPGNYLGMGLTAENLVEQYSISREDQDAFALESHRRSLAAEDRGLWKDERIAIRDPYDASRVLLEVDEGPRRESTLEALASLKPSFRAGGTITPGNSSPLTDGAAAVLVVSKRVVEELGATPLGRLRDYVVAGVDPAIMGIAPAFAVPRLLQKTGWSLDEVDQIELNEAFAAQSLAVIRELGLDGARTNPLGGAIALGHPLGCSGARLVGTLLHDMRRNGRSKGIVTLCVGGGMGAAASFELV